jgi:DNA-binding response OmpR family regulator
MRSAAQEPPAPGDMDATIRCRPTPTTIIRELDRVVTRADLDKLAEEYLYKQDKHGLVLLEEERIVWREGYLPAEIRRPTLWRLFMDLYRNLGHFRTNSAIINAVWEDEEEGNRENLYVQISELKKPLNRIRLKITNNRELGYRLEILS